MGGDKLKTCLHRVYEPPLLREPRLVLPEVADDLDAPLNLTVHHLDVLLHREGCQRT